MDDPAHWDHLQVANFLRSFHLSEKFVQIFVAEEINGCVFLNLTREKLSAPPFNIKRFSPLETILGAVQRLQAQSAQQVQQQPPPPPPQPQPRMHAAAAQAAAPCGDRGDVALGPAMFPQMPADGGPPVGMSFPMMPPPPDNFWDDGPVGPHGVAGQHPQQRHMRGRGRKGGGGRHDGGAITPAASMIPPYHPAAAAAGMPFPDQRFYMPQVPGPPPLPVAEQLLPMQVPAPPQQPPGLVALDPPDVMPDSAGFAMPPEAAADSAAAEERPAGASSVVLPLGLRGHTRDPGPPLQWSPSRVPGLLGEFNLASVGRSSGVRVRDPDAAAGGVAAARVDHVHTFAAPPPFRRVEPGTNLSQPPSNWLEDDSRIASQYNPGKLADESREFPASALIGVDGMTGARSAIPDFMAPADTMKHLFTAPFSDQNFAMSIHRVGDSLIMDGIDVPGAAPEGEVKTEDMMMSKLLYYSILNQEGDRPASAGEGSPMPTLPNSPSDHSEGTDTRDISPANSPPQGASEVPDRPDAAPTARAATTDDLPRPDADEDGPAAAGALLPRSSSGPADARKYQRTLRWQFRDLNLVLGSNKPVMRHGDTGQEVMLQLVDEHTPVDTARAMEFWIDNVMSSVSQVAVCFHKEGIIQGYQLIATNDLPSYVQGGFEPQVVQEYAGNVLEWLKEHCRMDAGSYILVRDGKNLKLYDLNVLYTGSKAPRRLRLTEGPKEPVDWRDEDPGSPEVAEGAQPFAFPVGMLCLRMGVRVLETSGDGGRAVRLLEKALELLGREGDDPMLLAETNCALATAHLVKSYQEPWRGRGGSGRQDDSLAGEAGLSRSNSLPIIEDGLIAAHKLFSDARILLRSSGAPGHVTSSAEERLLHCRLSLAAQSARQVNVDQCFEWIARAESLINEVRTLFHSGGRRCLTGPTSQPSAQEPRSPGTPTETPSGDPLWLANGVVRLLEVLGDAHQVLAETLFQHPADDEVQEEMPVLTAAHAALERLSAAGSTEGGFLADCNPPSADAEINSERALQFFKAALAHSEVNESSPDAPKRRPYGIEGRPPSALELRRKLAYTMLARAAYLSALGNKVDSEQLRETASRVAHDATGECSLTVAKLMSAVALRRPAPDVHGMKCQEEALHLFGKAEEAGGSGPIGTEARLWATRTKVSLVARRLKSSAGDDFDYESNLRLLTEALAVTGTDGSKDHLSCVAQMARLHARAGKPDRVLSLLDQVDCGSIPSAAAVCELLCDVSQSLVAEAVKRRGSKEAATEALTASAHALGLCVGRLDDGESASRVLQCTRTIAHELARVRPDAAALEHEASQAAPTAEAASKLLERVAQILPRRGR
eukprot:TRINITY_DN1418_c0_g1_i2.p1 TRINITY_DN1418_c0_g1~~TRINITY_DN1418_c0_g1_i2.p1  ORF type:complete len:1339 (+),score=334.16 TRINITY_DN1418_c0_g1_i2:192-4208(+)